MKQAELGRLAMREEGDLWCAYYATPGTMKGAILLGSIQKMCVHHHPERRAAFMDLMKESVADLIEAQTGMRPVWGTEKTAPEHERSKKA